MNICSRFDIDHCGVVYLSGAEAVFERIHDTGEDNINMCIIYLVMFVFMYGVRLVVVPMSLGLCTACVRE
jgi:Kef-type K+ transport system membrane component KefB